MTSDDQLAFAGPAKLAALVRGHEVSPRELVELFLGRIERLDPDLNAFRVVMAEQALTEAAAVGDLERPLAGVPMAIKDDLPLAGQAMTWGSRSYSAPKRVDAEPIRRLREAGAIPLGVTNVPELMIWPWTATVANGVTRNPWDPARTPGGSSGGSAAAVASGMAAAATASDGGGSIRIPAACCGLVGNEAQPRARARDRLDRAELPGRAGAHCHRQCAAARRAGAPPRHLVHRGGRERAGAPADRRLAQGPAGHLCEALGRSAASLGVGPRPAGGAWPRGGGAGPGLRPRDARVRSDLGARHL